MLFIHSNKKIIKINKTQTKREIKHKEIEKKEIKNKNLI